MTEASTRVTYVTWRSICIVLLVGFVLPVATVVLTGCDSAKSRAEAEAVRSDARVRAVATQQALDVQATVTAIEIQDDLETQTERIRNREMREWWLNLVLIGLVACLTALGVGWVAGEVRARHTRALNEARTYRPDPQTGALPVVRVDHMPARAIRLAHEAVSLIRLVKPGFEPPPLQYATILFDLDTGTHLQVRQVVDGQGRLHVWQETCLAPLGQHTLAHHTRQIVTLGHAMARIKQDHEAAGEIAHAIPQVGHIPAFEPSDRAGYLEMGLIRLGERDGYP